ncbi:glycylpeptide N-tetradecanoyltransferase [Apiospora marii]|uniref:glycylpeptide N-tetradecanoyltransferase n=1 Tax=Apiospora marii TaxID=335849 RepID=UPI00312F1E5D
MRFPTVAQITRHPAFETAVWKLRPHQSGLLPVGATRGGPHNVSWEIHGNGPIKMMLIGGLGVTRADWQRQTHHFGHLHKDRYSVLLVDNLGVGASDKPFSPTGYTTSGLAQDLLEVADHVKWTAPRSLHVGGGSLGGMIAQAVAREAPERIARLALWSTCPRFVRTGSWPEHLRHIWAAVAPKTFEAEIRDVARGCFPEAWLAAAPPADDGIVVDDHVDAVDDESRPGHEERDKSRGAVPRFGTNYELWAAGEIAKHRAGHVTRTGHWMQTLAAARHALDAEQLRSLGDEVGRERILVLHGDADGMMPVELGRVLMAELRPARCIVVEGMGHAPIQQRADWFNGVLGEWFTDEERPSSTSGR